MAWTFVSQFEYEDVKTKSEKQRKQGREEKEEKKEKKKRYTEERKKKEKEKNVSFVAGTGQKHEWTNGPATILNYVCMTRE